MNFVQGHKSGMDAQALAIASQHIAQQSCGVVACALMSAHKAAQCIAEAARAVASQHLAQQSLREVSPQFQFRYQ